jgi:hypothetical protein
MNPAPSTPSVSTSLGSGASPSMPGSFFSAVVAKKRNISSFATSPIASSPNERDSAR